MKRHLEIRFGREMKMYTLWVVSIPEVYNPYFNPERYIKNLSTNLEEAQEKAQEYAKKQSLEVLVDAPDELREIKRGEDVLRFGRYKDMRVSEIEDEKYLLWLFKGAPVKELDYWVNKLGNTDPIKIAATNILLERGILVEFNDRLMSKDHAEALKLFLEKNANSDFIGSVGDKIEIEVTVEKVTWYDSVYGTTYITTMRDSEDNVIVYRGKSLDKKDENGYMDSVRKGDSIKIKGSIKEHSEYKGVKQTIVQRVKVL